MGYTDEEKKTITEKADEICKACDGLPLWQSLEALRLAHQRLEMMGVVVYDSGVDVLTYR